MARKVTLPSLASILRENREQIIEEWVRHMDAGPSRGPRVDKAELRAQCMSFLDGLLEAVALGNLTDVSAPEYDTLRDFLDHFSRSRAASGFTSSQTATFIFALKRSLFAHIQTEVGKSPVAAAGLTIDLSLLLDDLALRTVESYQKGREQVIIRQQQEIAELSTPVVQLWDGILAIPLIGTLDSARTQVVMENLLQSIVDYSAEIAVIDITGVPTVDTLVAQHLLKTVAAARLMGADCIISGIRPQIAQTMVHLGVELDVATKSSLADAFALALERTGRTVRPIKE